LWQHAMRAFFVALVASVSLRSVTKLDVALRADAACGQPSPSSRCQTLCKGNDQCVSICEQVRAMMCDQTTAPAPDAVASAAAASAAATNAVRAAVQEVVAQTKIEAETAAKAVAAQAEAAVAEARANSQRVVEDAASAAAVAAQKRAEDEMAEKAHHVASQAAAAANAAAAAIVTPAPLLSTNMTSSVAPAPAPSSFTQFDY